MSNKGIEVKVTGDARLVRKLYALQPSLRKRVLRPAVTAAARPVRQAAKANVPVRYGFLKKSIDLKAKSYKETAVAIIGPRSDLTFTRQDHWGRTVKAKPSLYAHLVERGSRPHPIPVGKDGRVVWHHRGSRAHRFMERAWTSQAARAAAILNERIKQGLEKLAGG